MKTLINIFDEAGISIILRQNTGDFYSRNRIQKLDIKTILESQHKELIFSNIHDLVFDSGGYRSSFSFEVNQLSLTL